MKVATEASNKEKEMVNNIDLNGFLTDYVNTGASLSKCCHFFHADCLANYLTTEKTQQNHEKIYMNKMIGIDGNYI